MPARRGGGAPSAAAAGSPSAHPPPSAAAEHQHHQHHHHASSGSNGMVALHRARFVDWSPSPVVAAAASADGSALAAAREDGGLELWETEGWSCVLRIPGSEGACITSLAWVTVSSDEEDEEEEEHGGDDDDGDGEGGGGGGGEREQRGAATGGGHHALPAPAQALVSAGLDGALTLWDLRARAPGSVLDAGGGAIWSLAVDADNAQGGNGEGEGGGSGRRLAAACDDGALRVFVAVKRRSSSSSSSPSSSPFLKLSAALPRAEGRALSVAWHPGGRALVSGSSEGALRAWDVASRRELFRVDAAGGSGKSRPRAGSKGDKGEDSSSSPLWAVAVAADGTLATGDGAGCVSLWDAEHGTLLARFPGAHASDVLALVAAGGGGGGDGGGGIGGGRRRGRWGGGGGAEPRRSYEGAGAGGTIFSAGADGRVASFVHQGGAGGWNDGEDGDERRVRQRGEQQRGPPQQQQQQRRNGGWAAGPARAAHTHDVRCLALLSPTPPPAPGGAVERSGGGHSSSGGEGRGGGGRSKGRTSTSAAAPGLLSLPPPLPQLLVSGGADAQLIVYARSSFATEHPARASRAPQPPLLSVSVPVAAGGEGGAAGAGGAAAAAAGGAPAPRALLLASQRRAVDVWRLGASSLLHSSDPEEEEEQHALGGGRGKRGGGKAAPASAPLPPPHYPQLAEGARVDVAARPARLARLELAGAGHVLASALASSYSGGKKEQQQQLLTVVVAASTPSRTALFELREEVEEAGSDGNDGNGIGTEGPSFFSVRRVPLPAGVPASAALAFAGPRRLLAAACEDGSLSVVDLQETEEEGGGAKAPAAAVATVASLAATLAAPASKATAPAAAAAITTTAALSCPPVSGLAVSDCGRWAATWSTGGRCHVFDLKGLEHAWSPPPLLPASSSSFSSLAGAAFTADGDLVLLSSSGTLACYDVQGRALRPPAAAGAGAGAAAAASAAAATTASTGDLPGSPTGVSPLPRRGSRAVLVCTPSALCSADLAAPRTPGRDGDGDGAAGSSSRSSRRAARAAGAGAHSSSLLAPAPAGTNPRPLPLEHPCLGSFFLSSKEALLVEAVWADVAARSLPPPVLRRRFGA